MEIVDEKRIQEIHQPKLDNEYHHYNYWALLTNKVEASDMACSCQLEKRIKFQLKENNKS